MGRGPVQCLFLFPRGFVLGMEDVAGLGELDGRCKGFSL